MARNLSTPFVIPTLNQSQRRLFTPSVADSHRTPAECARVRVPIVRHLDLIVSSCALLYQLPIMAEFVVLVLDAEFVSVACVGGARIPVSVLS